MNWGRKPARWNETILNFNQSLGRTETPFPQQGRIARKLWITRRTRLAILGCAAAVACLVKLSGCGHEATAVHEKAPHTPIPEGARDDPRVAGSDSMGDAIAHSLAVIHKRLGDLQAAYLERARIEGDLKEVAENMRPMIESARAHCDAIRRAAKDLKVQLPIAQAGYASAASSYRQRAEAYRDQALKEMNINFANQFDVLAADTPRRLELTDKFLAQLDDAQAFLAETSRCLRDAETAFTILSGGGKMPKVPPDLKAFSRRLDEFIGVVLEYEDKLLDKPRPKPSSASVNGAKKLPGEASRAKRATPQASKTESATFNTEHSPVGQLRNHPLDSREEPAPTDPRTDGLLPVGARYTGMLNTPAYNFDCHVSLEIIERSGNTFRGIVSYGRNPAIGRRGVRGTLTSNPMCLSFSTEWYEGSLTPESIRYELKLEADAFSGKWSSQSLAGTIYFASVIPNPKW